MKSNQYKPDNWVVLKTSDNIYKVLAGWSGGYLSSDSWRISSGIQKVEDDKDHWLFIGHSGSIYKCYKKGYEVRMNIGYILNQLTNSNSISVELMDEKTDWINKITHAAQL